MELKWEDVKDDLSGWMRRAEVPGGWIYERTNDVPVVRGAGEMQLGFTWQTSMCFVPKDPHDISHHFQEVHE